LAVGEADPFMFDGSETVSRFVVLSAAGASPPISHNVAQFRLHLKLDINTLDSLEKLMLKVMHGKNIFTGCSSTYHQQYMDNAHL